jgi:hypothetical protein
MKDTIFRNFPTTIKVLPCRCVGNAIISSDFDAVQSFISLAPDGMGTTRFYRGSIEALRTMEITVSQLVKKLLVISGKIWSSSCDKHVQAIDALGEYGRQHRIYFDSLSSIKWGLIEARDKLRLFISELLHPRFIKYLNRGFSFKNLKFTDLKWEEHLHQIESFKSVIWAPEKKAKNNKLIL